MSIRRAPRPKLDFTITPNDVFRADLSFRALGLLVYLLSKPDNWTISTKELVNKSARSNRKEGRDAIYGMISELEDAGYIQKSPARSPSGQICGMDYVVTSEPLTDFPDTANPPPRPDLPDTVQPDTANPTLVKTDNKLRTEITKNSKALSAKPKIPDWIPIEAWNGFLEMRASIKKPLKTDRAVTLIVNKLDQLRQQGHAPGDVLDQSTGNSWQGVFAIKGDYTAKRKERRLGDQAGFQQVTDDWGLTGYDLDANAERLRDLEQ